MPLNLDRLLVSGLATEVLWLKVVPPCSIWYLYMFSARFWRSLCFLLSVWYRLFLLRAVFRHAEADFNYCRLLRSTGGTLGELNFSMPSLVGPET